MRKFEICKGYEDKAILPKRHSKNSAGYDFHIISNTDTFIHPQETVKFKTGIKVYLNDDEFLDMRIRSSIGNKKQLILSNCTGVIDADFADNPENEGNISISLTNIGDKTQVIGPNERIAQGIISKYLLTDDDDATAERIGGIGSTGTK